MKETDVLHSPTNGLGKAKAIAHTALFGKTSDYLSSGALTLRADIDFDVPSSAFAEKHFAAYRAGFGGIYDSKEYSDCTLISSDKKEFPAHRCVLAAFSPFFRGMFKHGTVEQISGRADIGDVDGETLDLVLKYIYSGDTSGVGDLAEEVLAAADKFDIVDLRDFTVKYFCQNVDAENALRLLKTADQRALPKLNNAAADFIVENVERLRQTEECQQLKEENAHLYSILEAIDRMNNPKPDMC